MKSSENASCDIVILGAGIAGLLLASELSSSGLSVLIFDKANIIASDKYWLTNKKCIERSPEFADCIDRIYESVSFIAYNEYSHKLQGQYILWDSDKLVNRLTNKIITAGGRIITNHIFYSFKQERNCILLFINNSKIKTKLLIDCMGLSSPLVYALNIVKIIGYYILFGKKLELASSMDPIALANVIINRNPSFLEVFPTSDQKAYVTIIKPAHQKKSPISLRNDFDLIVCRSHYNKYFTYDCSGMQNYSGIIPVGKVSKPAVDRIIFYGEAGQYNPAATATCLSVMLSRYKETADAITSCVMSNNLKGNDLSKCSFKINNFNQRLQLNIYRYLSGANSEDFYSVVKTLDLLHHEAINSCLFGVAMPSEILRDLQFSGLFRRNVLSAFKPVLKTLIGL